MPGPNKKLKGRPESMGGDVVGMPYDDEQDAVDLNRYLAKHPEINVPECVDDMIDQAMLGDYFD